MKSIIKGITLLAAAAAYLGGQSVFATARPEIVSVFAPQVIDAKTHAGLDGKVRLIWDFNPGVGTYSGSALWILDQFGNVTAAGSPTIPAVVGFNIVPSAKSNIIPFGQKSGNTTLAFLFAPPFAGEPVIVGTWTYNSAGALIAGAQYGPFNGTTAHQVTFDPATGNLIIQWRTIISLGFSKTSVWLVNEFGAVSQAVGPFGAFGPAVTRGETRLINGNQQQWYWDVQIGGGHDLNVWSFDSTGTIVNSASYGPF